jgi:hypothetical protein
MPMLSLHATNMIRCVIRVRGSGTEPLTVCIAIRSLSTIFLISDRMITSGDIQFEPPNEKIIFLTSCWWLVKDIVDVDIDARNAAKLKRAEAAILSPLGLSRNTFLENKKAMDSGLVASIARLHRRQRKDKGAKAALPRQLDRGGLSGGLRLEATAGNLNVGVSGSLASRILLGCGGRIHRDIIADNSA